VHAVPRTESPNEAFHCWGRAGPCVFRLSVMAWPLLF
jgi:hypothetical protein